MAKDTAHEHEREGAGKPKFTHADRCLLTEHLALAAHDRDGDRITISSRIQHVGTEPATVRRAVTVSTRKHVELHVRIRCAVARESTLGKCCRQTNAEVRTLHGTQTKPPDLTGA